MSQTVRYFETQLTVFFRPRVNATDCQRSIGVNARAVAWKHDGGRYDVTRDEKISFMLELHDTVEELTMHYRVFYRMNAIPLSLTEYL